VLATIGLGVALNLAPASPSAGASAGSQLWVSPSGDDHQSGTSPDQAVRTVQHALELAQPGDTVHLAAGRYAQDVTSVRDGAADAPITVTGPPDAVIVGAGASRVVQVFHDHLVLTGFTIDGAVGDGTFRDKLVYALGRDVREGVSGLQLLGMTLQNAGGECVRLRYFSHHNTIAGNTIRNCGQDDFPGGTWAGGGKNGEGIYIGTAVDQWADGKNPTADPDASNANWVHDNHFDTRGNECVDIKEGASGNVVEGNDCTGQRDPESAGFDSRGDGNVFRANDSHDNLGAGVRLGGHTVAGRVYGVGNDVIGNRLLGNARGGLRAMVSPQGTVCGNTVVADDAGGNSLLSASANACPAGVPLPTEPTALPSEPASGPAEAGTPTSTTIEAPAPTTPDVPPPTTASTSTSPPATIAEPVATASGGLPIPASAPALDDRAADRTNADHGADPNACLAVHAVGPDGGQVEAEAATARAGRIDEVFDPARSGGRAMAHSTADGEEPGGAGANEPDEPHEPNQLIYVVETSAPGRFTLWLQGDAPTGDGSLSVTVDDGRPRRVDLGGDDGRWRKAGTVALDAGRTTIVVALAGDVALDRLALAPSGRSAPVVVGWASPLAQCSMNP
jgi:hypothetical protein